jgi:hypothetical protein
LPTIRIDEEVYDWLRSQALPFEDTPNSVLRKLAGLERQKDIPRDNLGDGNKETRVKRIALGTGRPRRDGKYYAKLWRVNVRHALYHEHGTWYQNLRYFPGALFDASGYVVFDTEQQYTSCICLSIGQETNVHGGISSIPAYKRMT